MNDPIVSAQVLGKQYVISHQQRPGYVSLRDVLASSAKRAVTTATQLLSGQHRRASGSDGSTETFWALRDVSFDLQRGEVVGIIGRNGSGKSTLLKILSRITEPTAGRARLRGNVASLLEVGTGFHPELTGRENIFLNGAILGMSRAETARKFDEIVAFAEVDRFIDTPVKRYSSGMYVRLAFAVAAHLEPDILVVDEVLAVGDAEFQKKCLGRLDGVASQGRTVLFVSHQMNQVRRLCQRCIWLQDGVLQMDGPTAVVTGAYEAAAVEDGVHHGRSKVRVLGWDLSPSSPDSPQVLDTRGPVSVRFRIETDLTLRTGHHNIALMRDEQIVWGMDVQNFALDPGAHELEYQFPYLPVAPGVYTWRVVFYDHRGIIDLWDCRPHFVAGLGPAVYARPEWTGLLDVPCTYRQTARTAPAALSE